MILIALGANLPGPAGAPLDALETALGLMPASGIQVLARSRWYVTSPVPRSGQPDYINGVVSVDTALEPLALMEALQGIEQKMGRVRSVPNAARTLDLDLIDFRGLCLDSGRLTLPHPRAHLRAFVLYPLRDVAPEWRHPLTGASLDTLCAALDPDQDIRCLEDEGAGS
ncbi:2-amino-4-hydroxy-6-hydroxymethyldihydropteridine diphosphokinase [Phaeovibrio sulfidiphilus]|uniref:2-amino-4-hydroxy-6-hydroxymethyldihydropteridine pyrophosphokinase n=1 Tax=Phaeovibrio sulfidiphilus TaxID=1220600 RepID=A0A8J6YX17_9PROT|nr:2-amino-4-hydroxy-6-hydroxymethyldihydropteridine diphosphokinase [Phaeovibrio sulfidiphilus]MBE1236263.1 2-amino-4-hydroxy-6-hydroxymethyldihydropteridine diphosphokinase [Phaeovibrio sulfidiphilus]